MSIEVHVDSVENIYFEILDHPPTSAAVTLSAFDVEVSLPAVGASPSSWVTCAWAGGTVRRGDERYYVVVADTDDFTIAAGSTYQPWIRIGGSGGSITKVPTTVKGINT